MATIKANQTPFISEMALYKDIVKSSLGIDWLIHLVTRDLEAVYRNKIVEPRYINLLNFVWAAPRENVSSSMRKIHGLRVIPRTGICCHRYMYILHCPMILLADNEGPDQTARMRSLIRASAVRICSKARFRMARPLYNRSVWFEFVLLSL